MNKFKLLSLILVVSIALFIVAIDLNAVNNNSGTTENPDNGEVINQDLNWTQISKNLALVITTWEGNQLTNNSKYTNKAGKLQREIERFKSEGKDTTNLENSLKTFNKTVEKANNELSQAIQSIKLAKESAQNQDNENFHQHHMNAKKFRNTSKDTYTSAVELFKNEINPEYKKLL